MKRKVLSSLLDSSAATNLTGVIAEVEHELLSAAQPLDEALDGDRIDHVPEPEERAEALRGLLEALTTGSMKDVWADEILPELVDSPEAARRHIGIDETTWQSRKATWAERWRAAGAEGSDEALAAHHVRDAFGVDLETFEERVVGFEDGKEAERLFAANFRAVRDVLRDAAEEVGDGAE